MAGSNQVQGKVSINIPSMGIVRSKQGASLDYGGIKRDAVEDDQGVAGYTEAYSAPSIDAAFTKKAGISVKAIADIIDEDISFEGDDGSFHVLRQAWCAEPPTLSGGEIKAKLVGISCDEVKA